MRQILLDARQTRLGIPIPPGPDLNAPQLQHWKQVEFDLEGKILDANRNFLDLTGYTLEEVKDQHHRMFSDADYVRSAACKQFWQKLGRGMCPDR